MLIEQAIIAKLTVQFKPRVLNVENESRHHHLGRGSETHFKVTLVSDLFSEMSVVVRHRAVYACLAEELEKGVHALALHLYSPNEWAENAGMVPKSPNCLGKGQ